MNARLVGYLVCVAPILLLANSEVFGQSKLQEMVRNSITKDPGVLKVDLLVDDGVLYYEYDRIEQELADSPNRRAVRTLLVAEFFSRQAKAAEAPWAKDIASLRAAADRENKLVEAGRLRPPAKGSFVPGTDRTINALFDRLAKEKSAKSAVKGVSPMRKIEGGTSAVSIFARTFKPTKPVESILYMTAFKYDMLTQWRAPIKDRWTWIADKSPLRNGTYMFLLKRKGGAEIGPTQIVVGSSRDVPLP